MKNIAILGLFHDLNLGDPLICRTVEQLYSKYETDVISWQEIDLRSYKEQLRYRSKYHSFFERGLMYFLKKHESLFTDELRIKYYAFKLRRLLTECQKGIIAGGGIIHYKFHDYCIGISAFIRACNKKNIPVVINAVGVEGYDQCSPKCKLFAKYLSYPNIQLISTRDDVSTLKVKYNITKPVYQVIDSVALCKEILPTPVLHDKARKVGIGLIRESVLYEYRIDNKPDKLYRYYVDIVRILEKEGIEYEFFCNGYKADADLINGIEARLNRQFRVIIPQTIEEMVSLISSYRGIITARMHSCIVAYAYNKPAVALGWNEKLAYWYQTIGRPYGCIPYEQLSAELAVNNFFKLEKEKYNENLRQQLDNQYKEMLTKAIQV